MSQNRSISPPLPPVKRDKCACYNVHMNDQNRIKLARRIMLSAGKEIMKSYGLVHTLTEKTANDYVSEVDLAIEQDLRRQISTNFPMDYMRGEEIAPHQGQSEYEWIFDPIDGTNNFIREIPLFAAQLALRKNGKTIYSIIVEPYTQTVYSAEAGKGAYRERLDKKTVQRIQVNNHPLARSLMTSTSTIVKDRPVLHHIFKKLTTKVADLRVWGTAALSYCYIASGQTDFYFSSKQKPWDVYPGKLLIEEAGGYVIEFDGKEWSEDVNNSLLLCTPGNKEELLTIVR